MKKLTKVMFGLLATVCLLASCMKSDDSTITLYSDTAITAFTLGTLNRYVHTTSSTGTDSVYKQTITGSNYKFSIDQENHRIFNVDSLPVGTDVEHVICSVSALNNGSVYMEDLESDDLLYISDSIDFSTPRVFRVYASDGSAYQSYTVSVNVHQEEGNQFNWAQHEKNSDIAALEGIKAVVLDANLCVYGAKDGKTLGYMTTDGISWTTLAEIDDANAYQNILVSQDQLYTLVNGTLQKSADGETWTELNATVDIVKLVAASYDELYGLTADGTLLVSEDEGQTWEEDALDTDKTWLPQTDVAYVCYPAEMTAYADYVLMAGMSAGVSEISSVWRKIVEYDLQGLEDKWVYMDRSDKNRFALPQLENLVMMRYDDGILAWGIKDGAFSPIYQSRDNGLVWKTNSLYPLPEDFENGTVSPFAATTDGKEIWLISGQGEVWQGHLNRIAWEKSE
ncbi:MAG: hypothetical protein IJV17_02810 [Prevotella sp.]|nr:hypothetical protein [Prevotella sp.]